MQSSSTGRPTKAQERRFQQLYEHGCICCLIEGLGYQAPQIHHIVDGGRRLGHDQTLPLCPWHHMGQRINGYDESESTFILGPSLALSKKRFVETYGTERELLERVNARLEAMEHRTV